MVSQHVSLACAGKVLRTCKAVDLLPKVTPAKTTGQLSPLDTHCFWRWKNILRHVCHREQTIGRASVLTVHKFIECMCEAIRHGIMNVGWETAFIDNGYGACQRGVSKTVRTECGVHGIINVGCSRPTKGDLAMCLPRRRGKTVELLWKLFFADDISNAVGGARGVAGAAYDHSVVFECCFVFVQTWWKGRKINERKTRSVARMDKCSLHWIKRAGLARARDDAPDMAGRLNKGYDFVNEQRQPLLLKR